MDIEHLPSASIGDRLSSYEQKQVDKDYTVTRPAGRRVEGPRADAQVRRGESAVTQDRDAHLYRFGF